MTGAWYVWRGVGAHLVWYMDHEGRSVGAPDRHLFPSWQEADEAARRGGWRHYEITWCPAPAQNV